MAKNLEVIPTVTPKQRQKAPENSQRSIFVIIPMTLLFLLTLFFNILCVLYIVYGSEEFPKQLAKVTILQKYSKNFFLLRTAIDFYFARQNRLSVLVSLLTALPLTYYFGMLAGEIRVYDGRVPWGRLVFLTFSFAAINSIIYVLLTKPQPPGSVAV